MVARRERGGRRARARGRGHRCGNPRSAARSKRRRGRGAARVRCRRLGRRRPRAIAPLGTDGARAGPGSRLPGRVRRRGRGRGRGRPPKLPASRHRMRPVRGRERGHLPHPVRSGRARRSRREGTGARGCPLRHCGRSRREPCPARPGGCARRRRRRRAAGGDVPGRSDRLRGRGGTAGGPVARSRIAATARRRRSRAARARRRPGSAPGPVCDRRPRPREPADGRHHGGGAGEARGGGGTACARSGRLCRCTSPACSSRPP